MERFEQITSREVIDLVTGFMVRSLQDGDHLYFVSPTGS
jgi:hypothetical protein